MLKRSSLFLHVIDDSRFTFIENLSLNLHLSLVLLSWTCFKNAISIRTWLQSEEKKRSIKEETKFMSSIKQRKTARQMKFARQNKEDCSDIYKLQNRWEKIKQRYQQYCERAERLNCASLSFLSITSQKLHLASSLSLISRHHDLCIDCDVFKALSDFLFRNLTDSLALCVYCVDTLDSFENEMR